VGGEDTAAAAQRAVAQIHLLDLPVGGDRHGGGYRDLIDRQKQLCQQPYQGTSSLVVKYSTLQRKPVLERTNNVGYLNLTDLTLPGPVCRLERARKARH
jgi:hypothetical protein